MVFELSVWVSRPVENRQTTLPSGEFLPITRRLDRSDVRLHRHIAVLKAPTGN
jgi:hypothetical protein